MQTSTYKSAEARAKLYELYNKVHYGNEIVYIKKGTTRVAMVSERYLEGLQELEVMHFGMENTDAAVPELSE